MTLCKSSIMVILLTVYLATLDKYRIMLLLVKIPADGMRMVADKELNLHNKKECN